MAIAYIGLGSNLGDRRKNLISAIEAMNRLEQTRVTRTSRCHETEPVGNPDQGKFLNAVAELQTRLPPKDLLGRLLEIEQAMGRPKVHPRWSQRTLDLDLLAYDTLVLETASLTLPHPLMAERPFVLLPLQELAPTWRHPKLDKTVGELLEQLAPYRTPHPPAPLPVLHPGRANLRQTAWRIRHVLWRTLPKGEREIR